MKIILGSASKTRQKILKAKGYKFKVLTAEINEKKIRSKNPKGLVLKIAFAKARAIKKIAPNDGILVTADQVAFCNGKVLEKAKDLREAEKFIRSYSNKIVDNISGLVVTDLAIGKQRGGVSNLSIEFKAFDKTLIKKALAKKNVLSYSGATCFGHTIWRPYIKKMTGDQEILFGIAVDLMKKLIKKVK